MAAWLRKRSQNVLKQQPPLAYRVRPEYFYCKKESLLKVLRWQAPEPGVCRGHSVQSHFRHEPESREWFPVQAVITDRHIRSHPQARQSIRLRGNGSGLRWSGALLILLPRSDGRLRLRSLLPMMGMEVCGSVLRSGCNWCGHACGGVHGASCCREYVCAHFRHEYDREHA